MVYPQEYPVTSRKEREHVSSSSEVGMSKSCASLSNVLNMFEFNLLGYFYLLSDVNTSFSCVVFVPFKSVSAVFPTPFHHFIPLLTNSQFFFLSFACFILSNFTIQGYVWKRSTTENGELPSHKAVKCSLFTHSLHLFCYRWILFTIYLRAIKTSEREVETGS